jgi:hypothetical protein
MDDTSPPPARRRGTQEVGKWSTIRYAVRGWGTTVRLCLICLIPELPFVLYLILRR